MLKTTAKQLREFVTIRPGVPSDDYGFATVIGDYKNMDLADKRVLDLGGNIGAFAVLAALEGARVVMSYEPEPKNFDLMCSNTSPWALISCWRAAVVDSDDKEIPFYLTNGASADGYSTIPFRGRQEIMVPAVNYRTLLANYQPEVVKMDIEGGEWDLLQVPLPDSVREIVVELHFSKRKFREMYDETVHRFAGWEVLKTPKNTGRNFHTIAHWRR